jgi:predicted transcriptional regulator
MYYDVVMATTPTSVRFSDDLERRVVERARRSGARKATVIAMAVDEWIRIQDHPRIAFVTALTGERRARLVDGPEVWTVAEAWRDHDKDDRDPVAVAETLGLTPAQVSDAIAYWADFRDEIDALIERNVEAADAAFAAWERQQALA